MADPLLNDQFAQSIGTRASTVNPSTTEFYNKQSGQGFQNPDQLFSYASNLGYGAISSFDQLKKGVSTATLNSGSIAYPQGEATKDPTALVAGVQSTLAAADKAALDQYNALAQNTQSPQQTQLEGQQNELYSQFQTDAKALEGKSAAYQSAEQALGVNDTLKQVNETKLKLTELTNSFDKAYNNESARLTTMGDILGSQGELRRQASVEIGAQSARLAALQENYDLAKQRAKETVDLQFAPIEQRIKNTEAFLQLNEARLSREEKKQAEKLQYINDQRKEELTKQKEARTFALENAINAPFYSVGGTIYRTSDGKAYSTPEQFFADGGKRDFSGVQTVNQTLKQERETVAQLAVRYPDAGITLGDSLSTASAKVKTSGIYRSDTTPKYIQVNTADGSEMLYNPTSGTYVPGYKAPATAGKDSVGAVMEAVGQYESGGNYRAIGPATKSGDRAYGKYQIMGNNVRAWTRQILGREMSPQEFLGDTAAQDTVAEAKLGEYLQKYGTVEDAASMWFSGRPVSKAGQATDVNGTSVPQYIKAVRALYDKQNPSSSTLYTKDQFARLNTLSDNVRQDPDIKYFQDVRNAYQRIQTTGSDAVGDLTLLRLYAKITDPTTGVREEEFQSMESAQGALKKFGINLTKRQINGERLTDSTRQEFKKQSEALYKKALQNYEQKYNLYSEQARKAQLNPDEVIPKITADSGSGFSVQAPDGVTYSFPTLGALEEFKRAIGLQ